MHEVLAHFERKELTMIACQCARIAVAFENSTVPDLIVSALEAAVAWANDRGTIEAVREANKALLEADLPGAAGAVYDAASVAYESDPIFATRKTIWSAIADAEHASTLNGGWPYSAVTAMAMRELCHAVVRARLIADYTPFGRQLTSEESSKRRDALRKLMYDLQV